VASYVGTSGARELIIIDKSEGGSPTTCSVSASEVWGDVETGELFVTLSDSIYKFNGDSGSKLMYDWWSRDFYLRKPINLGALRVDVEMSMTAEQIAAAAVSRDAVITSNGAVLAGYFSEDSVDSGELNAVEVNGDTTVDVPSASFGSLSFTLYADRHPVFTRSVSKSGPYNLPRGYKARTFSIRLQGNARVVAPLPASESQKGLRDV